MDTGDRVIIMNHPERPDLTGMQGVIVSLQEIGSGCWYRIKVHGIVLNEIFTEMDLRAAVPERRRK